MDNPNPNENPNSDNINYTNLMLFGTPNTPGANTRPPQQMPPFAMFPNPYFQQPPPFDYTNPYFPQTPFQQPPFQQPPPFQPPPPPFQPPPFFSPPPQPPTQTVIDEQASVHRAGKEISKRSHKKKSDAEKKSCNKRLWSPNEEAWLATCWCDSSEDSVVGNSQKRSTLWGTVQEKFNSNDHGWVRGADQLSSKWRVINNCCKNFNAIYESQVKAWGSGRDDQMIFELCTTEYYDTYTKNFTMKEAWEVVKDHPKWRAPPSVGGSGLHDEEDDFFESVDLSADQNELFGPDPLARPMGRNKARKAARSSGSSDAATSSRSAARSSGSGSTDKVDETLDNMGKYKADLLAARKASIESLTRQDRLRTAIQFMTINTDDIRDATDRAAILRMKRSFRQEFKEFYEAEDEGEHSDE